MALSISIGDVIAVTSLAWKTIEGARKACGEYDDLTREVKALYAVLRRLDSELEKPDGLLKHEPQEELRTLVTGCQRVLRVLDKVLDKYNALGEPERNRRQLWQKIRFGNGEVEDVQEQRARLRYYTLAISLHLNLATLGSQGRMEKQIEEAGGDIKEIQKGVNRIAAELMSVKRHEGSVMTVYDDDEKAFWKDLRRGLVKDGFTSSKIRHYKDLIEAYVKELVDRGVFDDNFEGNPDSPSQEGDHTEGNPDIPTREEDHTKGNIDIPSQEDDHIEGNPDISTREEDHTKGNLDIPTREVDHTKGDINTPSQEPPRMHNDRERFRDTDGSILRRDEQPAASPDLRQEGIGDSSSSGDGTRQERISIGNERSSERTNTFYNEAYIEQNGELVPITEATKAELSCSEIFDLSEHELVTPIALQVTLDELYHGGDRVVFVRHQSRGRTVYERLIIEIQPGCKTGTKIIFEEVGMPLDDGQRQDVLFIITEVQ